MAEEKVIPFTEVRKGGYNKEEVKEYIGMLQDSYQEIGLKNEDLEKRLAIFVREQDEQLEEIQKLKNGLSEHQKGNSSALREEENKNKILQEKITNLQRDIELIPKLKTELQQKDGKIKQMQAKQDEYSQLKDAHEKLLQELKQLTTQAKRSEELHRELEEKAHKIAELEDNKELLMQELAGQEAKINDLLSQRVASSAKFADIFVIAQESADRYVAQVESAAASITASAKEEAEKTMEEAKLSSEEMVESARSISDELLKNSRDESEKMVKTATEESHELLINSRNKSEEMLRTAKEESEELMKNSCEESEEMLSEAKFKLEAAKVKAQKTMDDASNKAESLLTKAKQEHGNIRRLIEQSSKEYMELCENLSAAE